MLQRTARLGLLPRVHLQRRAHTGPAQNFIVQQPPSQHPDHLDGEHFGSKHWTGIRLGGDSVFAADAPACGVRVHARRRACGLLREHVEKPGLAAAEALVTAGSVLEHHPKHFPAFQPSSDLQQPPRSTGANFSAHNHAYTCSYGRRKPPITVHAPGLVFFEHRILTARPMAAHRQADERRAPGCGADPATN
jgi:hypothetical protein